MPSDWPSIRRCHFHLSTSVSLFPPPFGLTRLTSEYEYVKMEMIDDIIIHHRVWTLLLLLLL